MKRFWAVTLIAVSLTSCRSSQPATNPFLRTTVPPPTTTQGVLVTPGEPYAQGIAPPMVTTPAPPPVSSTPIVTQPMAPPPPVAAPPTAPAMMPQGDKFNPPGGSYLFHQSSYEATKHERAPQAVAKVRSDGSGVHHVMLTSYNEEEDAAPQLPAEYAPASTGGRVSGPARPADRDMPQAMSTTSMTADGMIENPFVKAKAARLAEQQRQQQPPAILPESPATSTAQPVARLNVNQDRQVPAARQVPAMRTPPRARSATAEAPRDYWPATQNIPPAKTLPVEIPRASVPPASIPTASLAPTIDPPAALPRPIAPRASVARPNSPAVSNRAPESRASENTLAPNKAPEKITLSLGNASPANQTMSLGGASQTNSLRILGETATSTNRSPERPRAVASQTPVLRITAGSAQPTLRASVEEPGAVRSASGWTVATPPESQRNTASIVAAESNALDNVEPRTANQYTANPLPADQHSTNLNMVVPDTTGQGVARVSFQASDPTSDSNGYAYTDDYSELRGQLEYSADGRQFKLRYIPATGQPDRFGGSLVLLDSPGIRSLRAGDWVFVRGSLVTSTRGTAGATSGDTSAFAPRYAPRSVERVAR